MCLTDGSFGRASVEFVDLAEATASLQKMTADVLEIDHAVAFAMLRLEARHKKHASRIMKRIRDAAGERLRSRNAGNKYVYHAGDWAALVKVIHGMGRDPETAVEQYIIADQIEAEKRRIRAEKGHLPAD